MSGADDARRRFLLGGAVAGVTGFVGGVFAPVGALPVNAGTTAGPNAADVGFCTDMTHHHVQALAMCQRVLGRDTGDAV